MTAAHSASKSRRRVFDERFAHRLVRRLRQELGRGFEGGDAGVGHVAPHGTHVFDVDVLDLLDLLDEERHEVRLGQGHDEFVDGAAGARLEDVDADEVATHRADAAGDGAERTGPVRQPHAHNEDRSQCAHRTAPI